MSQKRRLVKTITNIFTRIGRNSISAIKKKIVWLLRTLFVTKKRPNSANAGFVLPTVAMVSIVVVLVTTAITLRSFNRAQNASNVRVDQAVLTAATPALDRGRAKLSKLFQDKRLPRATPTDKALDDVLKAYVEEYTLGDETPLKLTYGTDTLESAWRFPIDTDNNGKFDTYTLYGIYFKTPPVSTTDKSKYARARTPLEARTPPMSTGVLGGGCGQGTSANLVGSQGWVEQDNFDLKKSFFVYTATLPITSNPQTDPTIIAGDKDKYEQYKGNKSIAALEYQQDRTQTPSIINAVVYEDDIVLTPGPAFRLNGGIFTNSNFITARNGTGTDLKFYQVSSVNSCYYKPTNAKISVGSNIVVGSIGNGFTTPPIVDLFGTANVTTTDWSTSVNISPAATAARQTAYNSIAYQNRIDRLVNAQFANSEASDPSEVKEGIEKRKNDLGLATFTAAESATIRKQQLEIYFKKRTRRVPYAEVAFNAADANPPGALLQGSGPTLRPNDRWIYPTDPVDGKTATNYSKLPLRITGSSLEPKASNPKELSGTEVLLGDRVIVGNGLPELWWDKSKERFVSSDIDDTQTIVGVNWNKPDGTTTTETRSRRSTVQTLADVGDTSRDGEWELDAARVPSDPTEPVGGLRVVTGVGIYLHRDAEPDPSRFVQVVKTIWPDTNPVPLFNPLTNTIKHIRPYWMYSGLISDPNTDPSLITYKRRTIQNDPATLNIDEGADTPYLQMRATAVYHYKSAGYDAQNPRPIACVSSYYNPTNSITASNTENFKGLVLPVAEGIPQVEEKDIPPNLGLTKDDLSNNGIVYPPPPSGEPNAAERAVLEYQAELTYPNGRLIDDGLMARALAKTAANRTLSEQSAIDAQLCAIRIGYPDYYPGFTPVTSNPVIPHGAIRETTFLAPREVKANSLNPLQNAAQYDMPVKDRQIIETRATVLDLDLLRKKTIGPGGPAQEYLLPNSGLIYATRDDALPDESDFFNPDGTKKNANDGSIAKSALDFKIDPTRRPNAIMLINGSELLRTVDYRDAEKGFILATNLPAYVKGDFNLHTREEFTQKLTLPGWNNFYTRSTKDPNFACRPKDPKRLENGVDTCPVGDRWRPATVLADVVTLLSGDFIEGFRDQGDYDWSDQSGWQDVTVTPPPPLGSPPNPSNPPYNADNFPGFSFIPTGIKDNYSEFNNFVTQAPWAANTAESRPRTDYFNSYLNNFVTPIALRVRPGAYLTEVCPVKNVAVNPVTGILEGTVSLTGNADQTVVVADYCSPSNPNNWIIQTSCSDNAGGNTNEKGQIVGKNGDPDNDRLKTGYVFQDPETFAKENQKPDKKGNVNKCFDDDAPRRIAFARNADGTLKSPVQALGVNTSGKVEEFNFLNPNNNILPPPNNVSIPLLNPVVSNGNITALEPPRLQLRHPRATGTNLTTTATTVKDDNWLQKGTNTEFNLIVAAGDNPIRPKVTVNNENVSSEDNGGLHNFVRFMEHWQNVNTNIIGSFIQVKKSLYATGPFQTSFSNNNPNDPRNYRIDISGGIGTGYIPPNRQWGYDVALLSQAPDLFAQKLVLGSNSPSEYFREVSRDDRWVETLLCAKTNNQYAIQDVQQRPAICKT